jgi:hypothetical protein
MTRSEKPAKSPWQRTGVVVAVITTVGGIVIALITVIGANLIDNSGPQAPPATAPPATTSPTVVPTTRATTTTEIPLQDTQMLITDEIAADPNHPFKRGYVFCCDKKFVIFWDSKDGKPVWLSSTESGKGELYVDDAIHLTVTSGGRIREKTWDTSNHCSAKGNALPPPIDIRPYLESGKKNVIEIELIDLCEPIYESRAIYLVGRFARLSS